MGTRIRTHIKPKMRIISFVLAFVMVFVGLPYVGGNMEVKAEATGPNIYSDTKYSSIMGTLGHIDSTENDRYHYTGKITKAKVTMFDYVSDNEIGSGNSYNNCWQNEQGYQDVYTEFNSLISTFSPSFDNSLTSNSITVTYKSEYFASSDSVKAHIWRGSNESNDIPMTYDSTTGKFTCTFTPGNGICYPQAILFYKGNISGSDKTSDYNINMQTNHKYEFADRTQFTYYDTESKDPHGGLIYLWAYGKTSKSTNIYWKQDVSGGKWYAPHGSDHRRWYWTESWLPTKFKVEDASNNWNTGDKDFNGSIKRGWTNVFDKDGNLTNSYFPAYLEADIDYSKYTNPLYFGCFWMDNEPSGYTRHNTPSYNNFWWQANMGFKPYDTNNRGNASVQGLVNPVLSGGASGKLMDVRSTDSNPVELPYFSKTFDSTFIKYYDKDNTGDNINFPFYESYIAANSSHLPSGILSTDYETDEQVRFYQFCSKDSNLKFNISDVNNHKGYFTETTEPIKHGDEQDFLPFNANDNHNTDDGKDYNNHNLGFGAKFETTFKLQRDGCVGATKLENGLLVDVDSDTRIHTIFEFTGDDDLWVFIDGNLVLDMGGAHLESNGIIDFATKTATAHRARTLGDGVSLQDLNLDYQEKSIDFTSLLKPGSFYTDTETGNTYYNPNVSHTLTVFYMERGMLDSNLLIRFNYSPEANFSKMKIAEVTDFDNINDGLKNATMRAAEDDVFMYTVTNTNTNSDDVKTNSAKFPVAATSIRTNQSITTQLTPGTGSPGTTSSDFVPGAQDVPTAVANTSYLWVDEFADNSKIVGKSNSNGQLYLMYGTCKNLYPSADETKVGKESSAEFEKQFTRNSTMVVLQSNILYKPNRASTPGLFGDSNSDTGNRLSAVSEATRNVSDYYTTTKVVKDRDKNTINFINESAGTFLFNNDASVDAGSPVMLTEYFTNTPKTGAITITKSNPAGDTGDNAIPADKEFTIKVRFEDIFGVEEVDADNETDYTGIKYKVYDSSGTLVNGDGTMTSGTVKVTEGGNEVEKYCGTFKLKVGQTATIEGIPYKTKYIVYENEPKYAPTYDNNNSTVLVGTIDDSSHKAVPLNSTTPNNNNITVTNFSHTLTIKEVTDFSTVNSGLLNYTKKAAENDVFKYTVSNNGTTSGDVVDSGIKTPTYDQYNRVNNGKTTTLTKADPVPDTTYIYLDTSEFTDWETTAQSRVGVYLNNTTGSPSRKTVLMDEISPHFFRAAITGYTKVQFMRINKDNVDQFLPDGYNDWYDGWNKLRVDDVIQGATYKVTGWDSVEKESDPALYYPTESYNFDPNNSTAVANTNYIWTDGFASLNGTSVDDIDGMTGKTDNTGSFYLMHGETNATNGGSGDHESSANFYNQFARGSTMTVVQDGTLTSPNGGTPDTLKANNKRGASTSLATYYTTTKALEGSSNGTPDDNDTFEYNNTTRDTGKSIRITETFTNKVKTGSITISKKVSGDESYNDTFQFRIILTDVFGVTGNNVENNGYSEITITNAFNANGTPADKLAADGTFYVKQGIDAVISGIPVETTYQIVETTESGWSASYKIGDSGSVNGASTPASGNKISSNGITVSFINTPPAPSTNEIILTKTAKEQVGNTQIGATLAGAVFNLYDSNGNAVSGFANPYTTDSSGKITISNLPYGDYYFEEITAPAGYSNLDSNNVVSGTAQNKRVYFSIGDNTTTKYLTCADEMAPAYIRLFEHINDFLPDEWGHPTFIYKITKTGGKTSYVGLTFDGTKTTEQKINGTIKYYTMSESTLTAHNFTTDPIDNSKYADWYVEGTTESEYKGVYHIDSQGRIRVEPGEYTITRIPVSRYEFVTSGHIVYDTNTTTDPYAYDQGNPNPFATDGTSTVTLSNLAAGQTADVHYYDKVAYYDKFSHVDTKVNKFYKLDESKKNTTVKGISVSNILSNAVTISDSTGTVNVSAYKVFVDGAVDTTVISASDLTIDFSSLGTSAIDFSYNTTDGTITIQNATTTHHQKVYTVTAKYDNNKFTTTFDIAIP